MPHAAVRRKLPDNALAADALLAWYDDNARVLPWRVSPSDRKAGIRPDPYRVWLSEIMLQQTTVTVVRDYFPRFLARWPTVESMAAASLEEILRAWAGLGYYARARNLHACAVQVAGELQGVFPASSRALLELPGIGPYTAAALAAICHDERIAVVDGNADRVMARTLALGVPVREAKTLIRQHLQNAVPERAGDFAQAIMDLGASVCAPRRTFCSACPLRAGCAAAATGTPERYPARSVRPKRPVRHGHAFVIRRDDGAVWLRRRAAKGLLAKMAEVPGSAWLGEQSGPRFPLEGDWRRVGHVAHVFTHFRLELEVWRLDVSGNHTLDAGWWSAPEALRDEALPSLFNKVLATALEQRRAHAFGRTAGLGNKKTAGE